MKRFSVRVRRRAFRGPWWLAALRAGRFGGRPVLALDRRICPVSGSPGAELRQGPTCPTASHPCGAGRRCLIAESRLRCMTREIGHSLLGHGVSHVRIHEVVPVLCGWCEPHIAGSAVIICRFDSRGYPPKGGRVSHPQPAGSQSLTARTEATRWRSGCGYSIPGDPAPRHVLNRRERRGRGTHGMQQPSRPSLIRLSQCSRGRSDYPCCHWRCGC